MPLMDEDVIYTSKEAMRYLKISKPTYLKYIRLGKIRAVKVGNAWRVHKSELSRLFKVGEEWTRSNDNNPNLAEINTRNLRRRSNGRTKQNPRNKS